MKEKEIAEYLREHLLDPDSVIDTNFVMEYMALQQYELWYKQEVSPNLNDKDKLALAKKISDLCEREPILPKVYYPHDRFPEIKSFGHNDKFSGMQLYVVLTEIVKELGLGFIDIPSASECTMIDENQKINDVLKLKEIRDKITTRQQKLGV